MKVCFRPLFATLVLLAVTLAAHAIPADRRAHTYTQPDGSTLDLVPVGDERHHALFTPDGHAVSLDSEGFYAYLTLDAEGKPATSTVRVHDAARRSAVETAYVATLPTEALAEALNRQRAEHLRLHPASPLPLTPRGARLSATQPALQRRMPRQLTTTYPTRGAQRGLVILVQYADVAFGSDSTLTHRYFYDMLNRSGFDEYGSHGSVRDYFLDASMGQFDPTFDVYGPLTLQHDRAWYGANEGQSDIRPEQMVIEACIQLDPTVDFRQYDRDGDGVIDNVYVFYAGYGEANGGSSTTVWPHSADVRDKSLNYSFDNVQLGHYACSNELRRIDGDDQPDGIGTFTHEFSHVMGLPDLYETNYSLRYAFTPGSWDILDNGPYNDNGHCPPTYSAYERYEMGWLEPTVIRAEPHTATLRHVTHNEACLIPTERDAEYFLLENRRQQGWDAYIPGHGLLVWHIDYDASAWNLNEVNNDPSHQHVDLLEADAIRSEDTRDGDAFPGTAGVTSLTDDTEPSLRSWSGTARNVPLTHIRETGDVVRLDVCGGQPELPVPVLLEATDVQPDGFTVGWQRLDTIHAYRLKVYTIERNAAGYGTVCYASGYEDLPVGDTTSVAVGGLEPATDYYVTLAAEAGGFVGDPSDALDVRTAEPTFVFLAPTVLPAADIASTAFTARWEPMDEADGYEVSVYTKTQSSPDFELTETFDGEQMSGSWWSADALYSTTLYGSASPALALPADQSALETATLSGDLRHIAFWYAGTTSRARQNQLSVQVAVDGLWQEIDTLQTTYSTDGQRAAYGEGEAIAIPVGARALRFVYRRSAGGSAALDDIVLAYGSHEQAVADSAHTAMDAGEATELTVTDLDAETTYYYKVRAYRGDSRSRWSDEMPVGILSGIDLLRATPTATPAVVTDLLGRRLSRRPQRGWYVEGGRVRWKP